MYYNDFMFEIIDKEMDKAKDESQKWEWQLYLQECVETWYA